MPARWAFAIWGVIYVGEVCAYGKILMGDAPVAVHKSTIVGCVDGVEVHARRRHELIFTQAGGAHCGGAVLNRGERVPATLGSRLLL